MSGSVHDAAARGFGSVADEYERARPDYPAAAVDKLADVLQIGPGARVLDLGAGTGKLTRMLAPLGAGLVAAEPLASMREHFKAVLPEVPLVASVAEALPFAGGRFSGVVCAQAFHWFDGERALAEIRRVLGPAGRLALLWNVKDENVPWVRALGDVLRPHQDKVPQETTGEWRAAFASGEHFGRLEEHRFKHSQPLDGPGLVERYASASYVATLPEEERLEVLERIRSLTESHPDLAGKAAFELPYVTELHWAARR